MLDSILGIFASGLHIAADWFEAKQSPAMQASARAQRLSALNDAVTADVASQNTTAVEKDIAG